MNARYDHKQLESTIGFKFNSPAILEQALIHSSYVNEAPDNTLVSNERLEFLGDAVLGLWITERIFKVYSTAPEGILTNYRSILVKRETLAGLAAAINLGDYLFMGRGESSSGGRQKPGNLACALEALIAAVYLDQGYAAAGEFIDRIFHDSFEQLDGLSRDTNYKSRLQELIQSIRHTSPEYVTITSIGKAHKKSFTVEVRLDGQTLGTGRGGSKKEAESLAARDALSRLPPPLHPAEPLLPLDRMK